MTSTLGLDIGGANIKGAHSKGEAVSLPFALWKAPEKLAAHLRQVFEDLPPFDRLAVTMTGELCDCFSSKSEGVCRIVDAVEEAADGKPVGIWTLDQSFRTLQAVRDKPLQAAAANWLALAAWISRRLTESTGILLDIGSTTTDIVYLERNRANPRGWTDFQRLNTGELVYTGLRRTPVCAVLGLDVAAEIFATMLDAYVLLGDIPEDAEDADTADGRPRTKDACHARMARMMCADIEEFPLANAQALAERAANRQTEKIATSVCQVLKDRAKVGEVVLSGSGEVIGRRVAKAIEEFAGRQVRSLSEWLSPARSQAACAVAVADLMESSEAVS